MTQAISVLDLFTIGIGPSSSHTVGPMRAARSFVDELRVKKRYDATVQVRVELYASLALTGKGHGTDVAILLGLEGATPEGIEIDSVVTRVEKIRASKTLRLAGKQAIAFDETTDLVFLRNKSLPAHPNGLQFFAFDSNGQELFARTYFSIGGGFVVSEQELTDKNKATAKDDRPFAYHTGDTLIQLAAESGLSVSQMTLQNETCWRPEKETQQKLLKVWQAMQDCIARGCRSEGTLPGGLKVQRRAPQMFRELTEPAKDGPVDPLVAMSWVSLWAIAVNEENAASGRVVTAPTNGAAGIIPAVLHYFTKYYALAQNDPANPDQHDRDQHASDKSNREQNNENIVRFLLTAGAIGILYKLNASISGAEVGCQGEVGVACSMAAGALCEVLGGSPSQVENAAEIGMEHNLGLTCDPIGGLVQVPCIERNAMGAVKAINAARLALSGDGTHRVSLDKVMKTMCQTGADMSTKYKETSRGGLAVNIPEC